MEYVHATHTFPPIFDEKSEILILGSFPSVKSREQNFYYGHPQNRFWKVMAGVLETEVPKTISEKKAFLLGNNIALWDVIGSCDIVGSSDSQIKNVVVNDMNEILSKTEIKAIFANGTKAYDLYKKYCVIEGSPEIVKLPSTSPANAAYKVDRLISIWSEAMKIAGYTMGDNRSREGEK